MNFSTFLVIGKCDAVTYQVLGHLKTMLVLMFGFVALNNPVAGKNILGIAIALAGMVAYGVAENADKKAAEQKGAGACCRSPATAARTAARSDECKG